MAPGLLSLTVVDDGPSPEAFEEVQIKLAGIDIKQPGGEWIDLGYHEQSFGGSLAEPPLEQVPAGVYTELRFRFTPGSFVKLRDGGHVRDLKAEEPFVAVGLSLDLKSAETLKAVYLFHLAEAIRETPPGSGHFEFHPLQEYLACRDERATTKIIGKVTLGPQGEPVAGATVSAQVPSPDPLSFSPPIARTVTSRADGSYVLDLLPKERSVCDLSLSPLKEPLGSVEVPNLSASHVVLHATHFVPGAGAVDFKAVSPGTYSLQYLFRYPDGAVAHGKLGQVTVSPGTKTAIQFKK